MASEQMQRSVGIRQVIAGKEQKEYERKSLCVLLAWAYPELLATKVAGADGKGKGKGKGKAKGKGKGKGKAGGPGQYQMTNGRIAELKSWGAEEPLLACESIAIASITGKKIFWAMALDWGLLEAYGISRDDPCSHKVLGSAEEGGSASEGSSEDLPLSMRRYLVDRDCGEVSSNDDLVRAMAESGAFPPSDVLSMVWDLARVASPDAELIRRIGDEVVVRRAADFSAAHLAELTCAMTSADAASEAALRAIAEAVTPRLDDLPLDSEGGCVSGLLWALTTMDVVDEELFGRMAERALEAMLEFKPQVLSDVREVCFWSFHRASADVWSNKRRLARIRYYTILY